MNLQTKLNSESRCDYWKSLASRASYEPGQLAEIAEISLRQLERYFARDFTATPKAWLREQRMQTACRLLENAHSVKDAAYTLCFRHPSHFCREFKQRYGMTPSEFVRKQAMARTCIKSSGLPGDAASKSCSDRGW